MLLKAPSCLPQGWGAHNLQIFAGKTSLGDSVHHQPVLTAEKVSQSQESAAKPVTEMSTTGHTDAQRTPQNLLENCLMEILWVQNEVLLLKRVPHFTRRNTPPVHREKAMGKDQAGAEWEGVEGCECLQASPDHPTPAQGQNSLLGTHLTATALASKQAYIAEALRSGTEVFREASVCSGIVQHKE